MPASPPVRHAAPASPAPAARQQSAARKEDLISSGTLEQGVHTSRPARRSYPALSFSADRQT
ncbi:hypothetical protein KCP78_22925 [Salmonella enterica subsp. enterica]|nr:hypothetical protein KCP78_22925 [Salmonella enterica subsp. enterica]